MLFVSYRAGHPNVAANRSFGDVVLNEREPRSSADIEHLKELVRQAFIESNPAAAEPSQFYRDGPQEVYAVDVVILFWAGML